MANCNILLKHHGDNVLQCSLLVTFSYWLPYKT